MKMIAEDYGLLAGLIIRVIDRNKKQDETRPAFVERYTAHMAEKKPNLKDPAMAARWELYHYAMREPSMYDGQHFGGGMGFRGKLYEHLNDDHIDTALKKIVRSL